MRFNRQINFSGISFVMRKEETFNACVKSMLNAKLTIFFNLQSIYFDCSSIMFNLA